MRSKLLIVGMLLLSLVVLSGCATDHRIAVRKCLTETAERFCEERDCVVSGVFYRNLFLESGFYILKGEYRESDMMQFSNEEIKSCENKQ